MKLITLNTWGGRVHEPLLDFLKLNNEIDIFCLQEIYHKATRPMVEDKGDRYNLFAEIQESLPSHMGYFRQAIPGYGTAIFVKKDIKIIGEGGIPIYEVSDYVSGANHPRNLQYVQFEIDGGRMTVVNVHGLWNGMGKTDTEHRLEQSRRIKEFTGSLDASVILCGDLNLRPDTESIKILEQGMHNLVKEYGISSTRTSLYPKAEKFADYIFVSPKIEILDFKVLPDEVSDHNALYFEF